MTFELNIDWAELKAQKLALLAACHDEASHPLIGLLSLIDEIQDQAVDVHGVPENDVFDFVEGDD